MLFVTVAGLGLKGKAFNPLAELGNKRLTSKKKELV